MASLRDRRFLNWRIVGFGVTFLAALGFQVSGFRNFTVALILWAFAATWLLVALATSERIRELLPWARPKSQIVQAQGIAASTTLAVGLSAVVTRAPPEWTVRYSAQEFFHAMFPHLRGILFSLHRQMGEITEGRYFCDVTDPRGLTRTAEVETAGDVPLLQRSYPADFEDASTLPLDEGDYRVAWYVEDGLVRRRLAETTLRIPDDLRQ